MSDELTDVAKSVVGLAKAMGETPCAELLKLAGDGEEQEMSSEFPIESSIALLAKGLTVLTGEMQMLKAGKYPYPYPGKDEKEKEEEEEKKGPTTADVLTAIEKLTTSVAKLASLQSAVTKAGAKKEEEEEEEKEEEKAAKKKEEEEKETVKLSADGTPVEVQAAEKTSEPDMDELVKAQVDKRLEETLQRMGFLKSGASVIPVGAVERPGLLSKGGREETLQDMEKLSQLSFREINKYRMSVGGFNQN